MGDTHVEIWQEIFRLTSHLGNVLAVINDRKIASGSSGTVFSNDFTSDVSGLVALPNATLTHAGGELEVSVTSQGAGVQLSYTGTTPGKVYRLYFTADLNSQGSIAAQTYDVPTSTVTSEKVAGSDGVYYLDFLASSSQTTISIVSTVAGSRTFYLDDMVLELRPSVFARSLTSSYAGLQTYGAGVTASIVGHRLEVDNLSLWNGVQCVFPTEVGETYTVHYTLDLDGGPKLTPFVRNNITSANIQVQHIYSDGRYTLTFVAPSTETLFAVENPNSGTRKMYLSYLFVQDNNASVVDDFHYEPVLLSWSDYYAFGMTMPGRNGGVNSELYRYGMQGGEMDNEIKGTGNSYDFGARMYDPRLGRFFSTDPYMNSYGFQSPYVYAGNSPIMNIDYQGLFRIKKTITVTNSRGETHTITAIFKSNAPHIVKLVNETTGESVSYSFKTKKNDRGGTSLFIFKRNSADEIDPTSIDVREVLDAKFGDHQVTKILSQMADENPELKILIIGNDNIKGTLTESRMREGEYFGGWNLKDEENPMYWEKNGESFVIVHHNGTEEIIQGQSNFDRRWFELEKEYTRKRAETVEKKFFSGSGIEAKSRYDLENPHRSITFKNMELLPASKDAVGITIGFDLTQFSKSSNKPSKKAKEDSFTKSKHPRWL